MKRHRRLLISAAICLLFSIGLSVWQCGIYAGVERGIAQGISNGFFAAAIIWIGLGLLLMLSGHGAFRAARYLGYTVRTKFSRKDDTDRILKSYYDFLKDSEQEKGPSPAFLLLPGAAALIIASFATVIYII